MIDKKVATSLMFFNEGGELFFSYGAPMDSSDILQLARQTVFGRLRIRREGHEEILCKNDVSPAEEKKPTTEEIAQLERRQRAYQFGRSLQEPAIDASQDDAKEVA